MNEKITLPAITQLLALKSGDTKNQTEEFLKEFFGSIASVLSDGNQIKIKDLGVFKTITVDARKSVNVSTGEDVEIPSHRKVVFIPSKELSAVINEPFEMFETVELSDELASEMESATEISFLTEHSNQPDASDLSYQPTQSEDTLVYSVEDTEEFITEERIAEEPEVESVEQPVVAETANEENPVVEDSVVDDPVVEDPVAHNSVDEEMLDEASEEPESARQTDGYLSDYKEMIYQSSVKKNRYNFWIGLLCGIAGILLIEGILLLSLGYIRFGNNEDKVVPAIVIAEPLAPKNSSEASTITEQEQKVAVVGENAEEKNLDKENKAIPAEEEKESVPTAPSDQKVYDTITRTRYLTTMAKDHYGNFNLWPYIYEENKAFLGHPDRIKPGTQVVIPDLKKYGIDPRNPDDIEKAKKKGVEIYSHYR